MTVQIENRNSNVDYGIQIWRSLTSAKIKIMSGL